MLIIVRHVNEGIVINGDVTITPLRIVEGSGKVKFGIDAPKSVRILKEESFSQDKAEEITDVDKLSEKQNETD
jgi:carbon storage regulator CsrA